MSDFEQKVKILRESIENGREVLGEHESQFASECAMFGDAGPRQAITIREIKEELAKQEAVYARMMATPIGKAVQAKWDKEYKEECEKYALDNEKDWPF